MRRRDLLRFLRFWRGVIVHAPSLLVLAFKRLDLGLSVAGLLGITGVAALFDLVSLWVPIIALLVYGLMWSIYDKFDEIRATNETLQSQITTGERRATLKDLLGNRHEEGRTIFDREKITRSNSDTSSSGYGTLTNS